MIKVIKIELFSDDVLMNNLTSYSDDAPIRDIYKYVKDSAMKYAKEKTLASKGRMSPIVDMSEVGKLPHASIIENKIIVQQIFATRNI